VAFSEEKHHRQQDMGKIHVFKETGLDTESVPQKFTGIRMVVLIK
jgi:hypothetical protein